MGLPLAEPRALLAGSVKLWLAQGFGVGRIPVAPGTFGSLLGLLWFGLLLTMGSVWLFTAGTVAGIALSVWLCGAAEAALSRKDPSSVVLDEIAALPVSFVAWMVILLRQTGSLPSFAYFLSAQTWALTVGVFVTFRFFDVAKPWPVRQSQSLPGGWGMTVDDLLAAVYVNAVVLLVYAGKLLLTK
jgi:phosphatidylglycerophosphatase A